MSRLEGYVGNVTEILKEEGETLESLCERIAKEAGYRDTLSYDSYEELVSSEMYDKFAIINDKVYDLTELVELEEGSDIAEAIPNVDGSIHVVLQYYNGGTCLNEALEYALNRIK